MVLLMEYDEHDDSSENESLEEEVLLPPMTKYQN